ncbi:MAG: hypothetical protein OXC65_04820 [Thiotrichales bacterium]|nr:hypothetical protein [Thiotrichales bacterium]
MTGPELFYSSTIGTAPDAGRSPFAVHYVQLASDWLSPGFHLFGLWLGEGKKVAEWAEMYPEWAVSLTSIALFIIAWFSCMWGLQALFKVREAWFRGQKGKAEARQKDANAREAGANARAAEANAREAELRVRAAEVELEWTEARAQREKQLDSIEKTELAQRRTVFFRKPIEEAANSLLQQGRVIELRQRKQKK